MVSLGKTLTDLIHHFPSTLLPLQVSGAILSYIKSIPTGLTSAFGFERALGVLSQETGFLLHISPSAREFLIGLGKAHLEPCNMENDFDWRLIRNFGQSWNTNNSFLSQRLTCMWMEFDFTDKGPTSLLPSVFVSDTEIPFFEPTPKRPKSRHYTEYDLFFETTYKILVGHENLKRKKDTVLKCLSLLPKHAELLQIGMMLSRPGAPIRLCIKNLTCTDLIQYLEEISWSGCIPSLINSMSPFISSDSFVLHMDINSNVGRRLGFEIYPSICSRSVCGTSPEFENKFLDNLVGYGLCTISERKSIEQLNQSFMHKFEGELWYSKVDILAKHIKIVYESNTPMYAKIYFGAMKRPA